HHFKDFAKWWHGRFGFAFRLACWAHLVILWTQTVPIGEDTRPSSRTWALAWSVSSACRALSSASSCRSSIPCSRGRTAEGGDAMQAKPLALVPIEHITRAILVLRGHKVLLDTELAALYGVSTKRFNEQVRRNRERFP